MYIPVIIVVIGYALTVCKCTCNLLESHKNHTHTKICNCITYDTVEEKFLDQKIRFVSRTNSSIPILHENVVQDVKYLEKITLTSNGIKTIKSSAFKNLPDLKAIDLSNNVITEIEFGIFFKTPKVTRINLENNNLWHFEPEWFGEVPNLEWLDLKYNSIKTILEESFSKFPNLVHLNLAHNKIGHVDVNAFKEVKKLQFLDLSYNRLSHLDDNMFLHFQDLHVLNLYSNQFSYLSDQTLQSLTSLREIVILFNPWQCECYNKLLEWGGNNLVGIRNKYLKCKKTKHIENIPVCVYGSQKTKCIMNKLEELCDILYLQTPDFECEFSYYDYLVI